MHSKTLLALLFSTMLVHAETNTTRAVMQKNINYGKYDMKDVEKKARSLNTQSLVSVYTDYNATLNKYDIDRNFMKNTHKNNSSDAAEAAKKFSSKETKQNIEQMKGYILEDDTFKYKGVSQDIVKKSNIAAGIKRAKATVFPNAVANEEVGLDPTERIFIFISSSMPEDLIQTYLSYAERSNGTIHVALRGFVGGPEKIMPTQQWVKKMITKQDGGTFNCGIEINPTVQMQYSIDRVPAVLYIKDYDPMNDGHTGEFKKDDQYWIGYGAVDLLYTLEKIQKDSKSKGFKKFIKTLRGDFYK